MNAGWTHRGGKERTTHRGRVEASAVSIEALAGKIEEVADVADRVEDMSGPMDQLPRIFQQIINNCKPATAAKAASNINGPGRSPREWQIQKLELSNDVVLWRKLCPRSH